MGKAGWAIITGLAVGFIVWLFMEYVYIPSQIVTIKPRKNFNLITFRLPNTPDPDVFGAPFWKARHTLAELTPCPACRGEAVSHEIFFHDWVNVKTKKDIKYKENYNEWIKKICDNKNRKA